MHWTQTAAPVALSVLLGALAGSVAATSLVLLARHAGASPSGVPMLLAVLGAGLALTACALLLCHPLHHRRLADTARRAD